MKKILVLIVVLCVSTVINAQLAVTNAAPYNTPAYLVNNVLLGQGVSAANITFSGNANQIGYFSNGLAGGVNPLGLDSGIVISSGNVNDIPTGGNLSTDFSGAGDPDLLSIAQTIQPGITTSQDAGILEFDFIPQGDTVEFRFAFASDEYLTFINSNFNDIFAFFLSGPGYTGPFASPAAFPGGATNLALVPGTTSPITISTIYVSPTQTPPMMNGSYFINNPGGNTFDFNGYTTVISIKFPVTCNGTYHFKFAVSDCQDGTLDTGVFMEGSSFSSEVVQVNVAAATGDSTVIEGCADATIQFTRPDTTGDFTVHFAIGGTATNGIDYNLIADSVNFPPGIDTASINIFPIADFIPEPQETIIITVTTVDPCGNIITSTGTIYILDLPNMITSTTDINLPCPVPTLPISVIASNALQPFSYVWTDSGGNIIPGNSSTVQVPGLVTDTFFVNVTDSCNLVTLTDTVIITVLVPNLSLQTSNDTTLNCPNYTINIGATLTGGTPPFAYTWTPAAGGPSINVSPTQNTTYVVTATDGCFNSISDSVVVTVNYTPMTVNLSDDITLSCPNLTYPIEVIATPTGGTGPYAYLWAPTSADTNNTINISVNTPQVITTTITDFCNLTATGSMNVFFAPYTPLSLSTAPVDTTCANEFVNLTAIANDGVAPYSYLWSNGNTGSPTKYSSSILGENIVTVTVTDECALQETTDMIVDIMSCEVDVFTVISPNGDGANDFLTFKGIENFPNNHLTVLNRWGKKLLEMDHYQNDWDGDNINEGTYFYVLELNNSEKTIHKGSFSLLK